MIIHGHQYIGVDNGHLTKRQLEAVVWSAEGVTAKQLADRLCLTERTVKKHIVEAATALQATNKASLVAKAFALGILRVAACVAITTVFALPLADPAQAANDDDRDDLGRYRAARIQLRTRPSNNRWDTL